MYQVIGSYCWEEMHVPGDYEWEQIFVGESFVECVEYLRGIGADVEGDFADMNLELDGWMEYWIEEI